MHENIVFIYQYESDSKMLSEAYYRLFHLFLLILRMFYAMVTVFILY